MRFAFFKIPYQRFTYAVREEMTPVSTNFLTLDFLRFFAALIVIMLHYNQEIATESFHDLVHRLLSHGHLFVDLFFIISGFIISYVYWGKVSSKAQYGKFLIKRIARLWPLHILLLLAYLAIWGATSMADIPLRNPDRYDVSCIIPHALMIHAMGSCDKFAFNYVSWSISAEMGMYVLTPLFFLIAMRSLGGALFASVAASVLLCWGAAHYVSSTYLNLPTDLGVLRAIPAFLFGIFLYRVRDRLGFVPVPQILLWVVLVGFFTLSFLCPDFSDYSYISLIYAISLLAVSVDARGVVPALIQKLAPLGSLTYGSYMLHPIISTVVFAFVAQHVLGLKGIANDITILLMIPLSFIAAVFSLVLIETPCRRLISKL